MRRQRDVAANVGTLIERFSLQVLNSLSKTTTKQVSDRTSQIARLAGNLPPRAQDSGKRSRHDQRISPAGDCQRATCDCPVELGIG